MVNQSGNDVQNSNCKVHGSKRRYTGQSCAAEKICICALQCLFFSSRTHWLLFLYTFLGNCFEPEVIPKLVSILFLTVMLS